MKTLSTIFGSGVTIRNALYDHHVLKVRKLSRPVVSIGNISVGGSGKTPFVIALGELLKQRGIAFDVLSRGYGRKATGVAVVDPAGAPEQFGDEPLLIARNLQVPVVVGADRYRAGLLAEKQFQSRLHLLDDGFQHRRLHRDFDIVMLPASDLHDALLPLGRLREPLSSLGRADAVVLGDDGEVEADRTTAADSLETLERVMEYEEGEPLRPVQLPETVWQAVRELELDYMGGRALAFCGIARPKQFFAGLKDSNVDLVAKISFPDHHRYSQKDVARLVKAMVESGAELLITTEKDLVNLGPLAKELHRLRVARLRTTLRKPWEALQDVVKTLEERCGCRF